MIHLIGTLEWLLRPEVRALLAAMTAFATALLFGRWFIRILRQREILESVERGDSERLDKIHAHKKSTPTLGGVILLVSFSLATLVWARLDSRPVLLLLGLILALGLLGFVDDAVKLKSKRKGISARRKLLGQILVSVLVGLCLYVWPPEVDPPVAGDAPAATALFFPFLGGFSIELGVAFIPFAVLVISGSSNAVNLTDGLDGLAAGLSVLVALAFVVVALLAGNEVTSRALLMPHVLDGPEVAVFAATIAGGGLGFLWFNCHPAQIFMGDTGALPLGGALGLIAVLLKQEVLLAMVGGVLVVEALSVILQVLSFKIWKKRIFRIAPLHHHFEFKGWAEARITVTFWVVGAVLALGSLAALRVI